MVHPGYVYKGLCGLARAHRANGMAGHLGAALLAGSLFSEEHPELDDRVHTSIAAELDRITAGEESWFDPDKAGITIPELFEPFPSEAPEPEHIPVLADALSRSIDELHQSGHNVIFSALAIRALRERPEHATPAILAGIGKLIEGFVGTRPGRLYFSNGNWFSGDDVSLPSADGFPPYAGEREMAQAVVDELIQTASEHRRGCGGLHHIINHAAALVDLGRSGHGELAQRGLAAHRTHIRLWRMLPNLEAELGGLEPAQHDPRTPQFWTAGELKRSGAMLTHRVKTLYGFHRLSCLIDDATKLRLAEERFLYLVP